MTRPGTLRNGSSPITFDDLRRFVERESTLTSAATLKPVHLFRGSRAHRTVEYLCGRSTDDEGTTTIAAAATCIECLRARVAELERPAPNGDAPTIAACPRCAVRGVAPNGEVCMCDAPVPGSLDPGSAGPQ